jgi:AcrR family transcriptional regulator
MSSTPSLVDRHTDATQSLILDSAVELLARDGVRELTFRAVAKHAGISERTVFRYFATRDAFLDAVTAEVARRIAPPPVPAVLEGLRTYPRALYSNFESRGALTRAGLHSEIYDRMREVAAGQRWRDIRALVDDAAPHRTARERKLAAANLRYYLAAATWHYFRSYFGFSLEETIEAAERAVGLVIDDVLAKPRRGGTRG